MNFVYISYATFIAVLIHFVHYIQGRTTLIFRTLSPWLSEIFAPLVWFYHCNGRRKYNLHSLFIASRLSTWIQLSISGLLIVMIKSIKNAYLAPVKHSWISIFCWWANRKLFLSARGNFWHSKVVIYNKTTCLLRRRCFNRYLWVFTPVIVISSC